MVGGKIELIFKKERKKSKQTQTRKSHVISLIFIPLLIVECLSLPISIHLYSLHIYVYIYTCSCFLNRYGMILQ